ncbi:MAG: hypothetical protein U0412_05590 [Nitrospira sp.]|mgnify:CR=1 FL=1
MMHEAPFSVDSRFDVGRQILSAIALSGMLLLAGCASSPRTESLPEGLPYVLAPALRIHPTMVETVGQYQNACAQPATIAVGRPAADAVRQKLGLVFRKLRANPAATADGAVDTTLMRQRIDVTIPRGGSGAFPAAVSVALDLNYMDSSGTMLFIKTLERTARGQATVQSGSCDVVGLEALVTEAVDQVSDAVVKALARSPRVREIADQRAKSPLSDSADADLPMERPGAGQANLQTNPSVQAGPTPSTGINQTSQMSASDSRTRPPASVTFRAIVRDDNRDQLLQPDEGLSIDVEVKNDGLTDAKGVEVVVSGTDALTAQLPATIAIGDVQPGEIKRATVTKPLAGLKDPLRGELLLTLRAASPLAQVPPVKKFSVRVKPKSTAEPPAAVDVEQVPKTALLKQPKAVVISVGVGRFRDEQVPPVKFAARDAEAMASMLQSIGGLPADRVRLLADGHALKQDLAETFEEWLPTRVEAGSVVYVYVAGRALVDEAAGTVSLVPYDGTMASLGRLYSVRRMQEALARLPIHRAILMFDLSLEHAPGSDPATGAAPVWETGAEESGARFMWMIGNKGVQEAHAYERGRHGLFTYHLLHGLQGPADLDRDGTIVAGELCAFARGEVGRAARDEFGNNQEPVCLPPPGQGAMVRIHPIAKGHNPKPAAPAKKEESATAAASPPVPSGSGPTQ